MRHITSLFILFATGTLWSQEEPKSPKEVFRAPTDRGYVALSFSPDGRQIATGGEGFVRLVSVGDFKTLKEFAHAGLVDEVRFDPGQKLLVSRSKSKDIVVRECQKWAEPRLALEDGAVLDTSHRTGSKEPAPRIAAVGAGNGDCPAGFSADGKWLAMASSSKGMRIWHVEPPSKGTLAAQQFGFTEFRDVLLNHVNAFAFGKDSLYVGEEEGYVTLIPMSVMEDSRKYLLEHPRSSPQSLDEIKKEADQNKRTYQTHAQAGTWRPHNGHITSLCLSPDKRILVTSGLDERTCVWELAAGPGQDQRVRQLWAVDGHFATLSDSGAVLAVAEKKAIQVYDFASHKLVGHVPLDPKKGRVVRMALSPDGTLLAVIVCACAQCVPRDEVRMTSDPSKRVHQHAGALVVWDLSDSGSKTETERKDKR